MYPLTQKKYTQEIHNEVLSSSQRRTQVPQKTYTVPIKHVQCSPQESTLYLHQMCIVPLTNVPRSPKNYSVPNKDVHWFPHNAHSFPQRCTLFPSKLYTVPLNSSPQKRTMHISKMYSFFFKDVHCSQNRYAVFPSKKFTALLNDVHY